MKNIFYFVLLSLFFFSCGNKDKEVQDLENAIAAIETGTPTPPKKENSSKLFFKASGTEPGWSVEIYTDKLRLLLDYGKDSVIIADNFEEMSFDDEYTYSHYDTKTEVSIKNGPCVHDGSGESLSKKVEVKRGEKVYKGCGEFVK